MANLIGLDEESMKNDCLHMSNGAMDAFLDLLLVTGSEIAVTESEKELVVWLAERDQDYFIGPGFVGFYVVDMPWKKDEFTEQQRFMVSIITAAKNHADWSILGYTPNMELLLPRLEQFKSFILQMTKDKVKETARTQWIAEAEETSPVKCGFTKCEKHGVLKTCWGCKICKALSV